MKIISTLFFGDVNAFESGFGPVVPPNMTVIMYVLDELIIDSGPYHLRKQAAQILASHLKPLQPGSFATAQQPLGPEKKHQQQQHQGNGILIPR